MKVAIVILNWNGAQLLKQFIPIVLRYSSEYAVYVIDNASTDTSVSLLEQEFPEVHIVRNKENLGFAGGYNEGLRTIKADIYCLLNSDVKITENWVPPLLRLFEKDNTIAIVQPKILDLKQPDYFEYAGAAGGFIDRLGYPFCRGRIFQALEKDHGQYDDDVEIFWATGACMFIRSSVFWELNGFDMDYFAHQEEIDLCWRAKNTGYKVWYTGQSKVYHLGGSTLENSNPKKTYLNFRNSLFSIIKNLPDSTALPLIVARLVLDGIAAGRFLLQFRGKHAVAIISAHLSFYANFRRVRRKRKRGVQPLKYHVVTSIVWSHFVHQEKNFNNLVKD
ncbi:MAG: glycosyltransferase family 2 protein [Bacteroidota bacterium]